MTDSKLGLRIALATALLSTTAFAEAPPAGDGHFSSDPAKSTLQFSFVQAGATNTGKFAKFPVTLDAAADGSAASKLDVTVDMTTMDSGDKDRDDTLRGPDLFSVAKFPQAHFTATQITKTAAGFDALRIMSLETNKLIRVNPSENSVTEIPVAGPSGHLQTQVW